MLRNLKAALRAARTGPANVHARHARIAADALNHIESSKGRTRPSDIRRCDEYAADALGHRHFAPWLRVYAAITGEFREGWIPPNYYGEVVVPKIAGVYKKLSTLRPLNTIIFQSEHYPDLMSYANGVFLDKTFQLVKRRDVEATLFEHNDRVVFKLDNSLQGIGVHVFDRDSFDIEKITGLGSGLFQAFIEQHATLDELQKNSVATLRVATFFEESAEISVRGCYLRLGSGVESHVQSESHVRVPIDRHDGSFAETGYTADWSAVQAHPLSGLAFSGRRIPNFSACLSTVRTLHRKVPYVRCVGWDIAVDVDERIKLMEWNSGHIDIKFIEATQGPCFSDLGWSDFWRK